jgi:two-component system sensor histidine kinase/response regulator
LRADGWCHGLLLTDFHMPEMDGFALTAAIRSDEAGEAVQGEPPKRHLPIVALTADAQPATAERCAAAGMDGYLTKPIDTSALLAVLARCLPQAAGLRRRADHPVGVAESAQPLPSPDLSALSATIDPAVFDPVRLVDSFGGETGAAVAFLLGFVDAAQDMVAAVVQAADDGNWPQARRSAHTLKGSALSVGAERLGQLAGDVQDAADANDGDTVALLAGLLEPTWHELKAAVACLRTVN